MLQCECDTSIAVPSITMPGVEYILTSLAPTQIVGVKIHLPMNPGSNPNSITPA